MSTNPSVVLVGDRIQYNFSFTGIGTTTPTDPTTVSVIHRQPDGVETTYVFGVDAEVTQVSVGNYRFEIRITNWRRHHLGAFGVGGVEKQIPVFIDVAESYFESLPS